MICDTKKSMIVNVNMIESEGSGGFFKSLGRVSAEAGEKIATNVLKIQVKLWNFFHILLLQPQLKSQKQLCHHYPK